MPSNSWSDAYDPRSHYPSLRDDGQRDRLAAVIDTILPPGQARTNDPANQWDRLVASIRIIKLAGEYNGEIALSSGSPRIADVTKKLQHIENLSLDLAAAITALDDVSLSFLYRGYHSGFGCPSGLHDLEFCKRVQSVGLPPHAQFAYPDADDSTYDSLPPYLAPQLQTLAECTALVRQDIHVRFGTDRGGGRNAYQGSRGVPLWHLTSGCWHVFQEYIGEPTATEDGPFYQFVTAVHEFATGGKDEPKGLRDQVRASVTICGERWKLLLRMPNHFGDASGSLSSDELERYFELDRALETGRVPPKSRPQRKRGG